MQAANQRPKHRPAPRPAPVATLARAWIFVATLARAWGHRLATVARVAAILLALLLAAPAAAQPDKDKDELSFDRSIRGLLGKYCYKCHQGPEPDGDVDLQSDENPRMIANRRDVWLTAIERIENGDMPPQDARQPSDQDRQLILRFLKQTVSELDCDQVTDPGRPRIRRLNRVEYNHAISDLTGLELRPADNFPPDPTSFGFDNISDSLTLTPVQVEQYHAAAQDVVAALLADPNGAAYQRVFVEGVDPSLAKRDAARQVLERLARRAFRRPVDSQFVDRLLGVYDFAIAQGQTHPQAIGHAMTAVLISPRFLMRAEQNRPDAEGAYPLDPYDLASRLSFFLWSSPPDETLLSLAASGALSKPQVLQQQARRMLQDPRSAALAENFFGQWLQVRDLQSHQPDADVFAGFETSLAAAMQQEVYRYVADMLQHDRSVDVLIDADYTFVNAPLAAHYGIEQVEGEAFEKVALQDRRRGGVLTMAAVLMRQSDPGRTNVPRRGNFIAGTILGRPLPPPPPNVPALDQGAASGKPLTLRETLELHRQNPECASCHDKMDPLGFAFENYDAIGRWREQENESGRPIDASGRLPGGRQFDDAESLKQILLGRREAFVRTLTKNLLIYALGRGLEAADECVITDAVEQAQQDEARISGIVVTIVTSYPFTHRRNPDF